MVKEKNMPLPKTEKELEAKIAELEAKLEEMGKKTSPSKNQVVELLQEVRDELKKLNAPKVEPKKEEKDADDDDWFK